MCRRRTLDSSPAANDAVGAARAVVTRAIVGHYRGFGVAGLVVDSKLVVSELLTNSLRAGAARTQVELNLHRTCLDLAVFDDAGGVPTPPTGPVAATAAGGRGLLIVAALARRWQIRLAPGGKQMWVRLTVPADAASTACSPGWDVGTDPESATTTERPLSIRTARAPAAPVPGVR